MFSPVLVGSTGVGLLLIAFGLNLIGRLNSKSPVYLIMNLTGALMAAWYAHSGHLLPLVILEGVWATVSIVQLGLVLMALRQK